MKKLTEFPEDAKFFRGTIIVLKDLFNTPKGTYDIKFCMISGCGANLEMLDLYKSIGGVIIKNIKPNVERCFAVNKEGIKNWVKEYFETFYTQEGQDKWIPMIDDFLYIEDLSDYFTQANRDLFMK